jgi:hypothetical protein
MYEEADFSTFPLPKRFDPFRALADLHPCSRGSGHSWSCQRESYAVGAGKNKSERILQIPLDTQVDSPTVRAPRRQWVAPHEAFGGFFVPAKAGDLER